MSLKKTCQKLGFKKLGFKKLGLKNLFCFYLKRNVNFIMKKT